MTNWNPEDDDAETITGAREKPLPSTQGASMMRQWHNAVDKAVEARGGDSNVAYAVLNKHLKELRKQFDDSAIVAGFQRFADMVRGGKIDVRDRSAWFSFWSRRHLLVRTVVYVDRIPDAVPEEPSNPFDIPVEPPQNPFER